MDFFLLIINELQNNLKIVENNLKIVENKFGRMKLLVLPLEYKLIKTTQNGTKTL